MSDQKNYLKVNRTTGELEFQDFPFPEKEKAYLNQIYLEFAFEPLDTSTVEKMNRFVNEKLEVEQ